MIRLNKFQRVAVAEIPRPDLAKLLFLDTRLAFVWLVVRLYTGWQWLQAGYTKLTGYELLGGPVKGGAWVFSSQAGKALATFARHALTKSAGAHPDVSGWYASFLKDVVIPHAAVFSYLIAFGEALVGIGLIVGALTGVAAFFGLVMNFNYLLAGSISINPLLGLLGIFLLLAWRVAGYYGADYFLLPLLNTPSTGRSGGETRGKAH